MPDPVVSLSLPCFNAEKTLIDTLRSILAQTFDDWELLAIDDGSTDGTLAILQSIDDPRVRVLSDGTNKGRGVRLNESAQEAKGKYFARMDADDLMFPERLAKQVEFLDAHPDVDLLGAGLVSTDPERMLKGVRFAPERVTSPLQILKGEVLYHPTVTGRTEWFRTHPYLPEYVYSDDFALWTKAAGDVTIANLREPLLFYLEHEAFTYDKFRGRVRETRRAIRNHGPAAVGGLQTKALLLRWMVKDSVYRVFQWTGLWRHALRLVNQPLSAADRQRYEAVLQEILATELPKKGEKRKPLIRTDSH